MRLHFTHIWPLLSLPRFQKQGNGQCLHRCNSSASPPCAHSAAQGALEVMSGLLPRGQGLVCAARRLNRLQTGPYSNSHGLLLDNECDYTDTSTSPSTLSRHSHFLDMSTTALMWERCSDRLGAGGLLGRLLTQLGTQGNVCKSWSGPIRCSDTLKEILTLKNVALKTSNSAENKNVEMLSIELGNPQNAVEAWGN